MPSTNRSLLMNLCHTQQQVVQDAIDIFNDSSKTDAEVMTALWNAGNSCVGATWSIPAMYGSYGQWIAHYIWQALGDGGMSVREVQLVSAGTFSFTGIETSVGPFNLRDRLEGLVSALVNYATQIDAEENSHSNTGNTPSSPSAGGTTRVAVTLTPL